MRLIIGRSLRPLDSSSRMRGVRQRDDSSRRKVQNVRGGSSAISRMVCMVLQLEAQVANVPVYNIALRHVICTPQVVKNFVAGQQAAGVGGQQIQEALLEGREVQLRASRRARAGS
jgi:hypothetical protein